MTGPDHYREAERLLAKAQTAPGWYGDQDTLPTLLAAAVHAMLANTAVNAPAAPVGNEQAWREAISPAPADVEHGPGRIQRSDLRQDPHRGP